MNEFDISIPDAVTDPRELSKLLKINVDFLKKEITDHIDAELRRFAIEVASIKNEGHLS